MNDYWNLELARVLASAKEGNSQLDSQEVCETFSGFLEKLRVADDDANERPRHLRDSRYSRDDGIVLVNVAFDDLNWFELQGYVWWIDQGVDPVWARLQISPDVQTGIAKYTIKCGVRRPGDANYSHAVAAAGGQKYLNGLLENPTKDEVVNAWISEQLSPEDDLWFFEFSNR